MFKTMFSTKNGNWTVVKDNSSKVTFYRDSCNGIQGTLGKVKKGANNSTPPLLTNE